LRAYDRVYHGREDIVQETLFEAFRKLDQFDDSRTLKTWLFGIAHHRSIDFLRKRKVRAAAETVSAIPDRLEPFDPANLSVRPALERLVTIRRWSVPACC